MRQNVKRNMRNKIRTTALKSQMRKLTDAMAVKDTAALDKTFRATISLLDKTAAKGTIHRKTANRRRSRLAKRVNALRSTSAKA